MKTCTIINGRSGDADRFQSRLIGLARDGGSQLLRMQPDQPLDDLVRQAQSWGCQRLIAAGGDGTVSALLNAWERDRSDLELAIIPSGTGNDLARSLGIPLDSIDEAWRIATQVDAVPIDVVRVTDGETSFMINAATGALGGQIAEQVLSEEKRRWGAFAYWIHAVSRMADPDEFKVELELDDQTLKLDTYGIGIANGRTSVAVSRLRLMRF